MKQEWIEVEESQFIGFLKENRIMTSSSIPSVDDDELIAIYEDFTVGKTRPESIVAMIKMKLDIDKGKMIISFWIEKTQLEEYLKNTKAY